jgi:hypothetical protein
MHAGAGERTRPPDGQQQRETPSTCRVARTSTLALLAARAAGCAGGAPAAAQLRRRRSGVRRGRGSGDCRSIRRVLGHRRAALSMMLHESMLQFSRGARSVACRSRRVACGECSAMRYILANASVRFQRCASGGTCAAAARCGGAASVGTALSQPPSSTRSAMANAPLALLHRCDALGDPGAFERGGLRTRHVVPLCKLTKTQSHSCTPPRPQPAGAPAGAPAARRG